jgi:hypothetical protein
MDKKFLDRVIDQIVNETELDYENDKIFVPFYLLSLSLSLSRLILLHDPFTNSSPFQSSFSKHCKNVYGLNYTETVYVWDQFRNNINNKIR